MDQLDIDVLAGIADTQRANGIPNVASVVDALGRPHSEAASLALRLQAEGLVDLDPNSRRRNTGGPALMNARLTQAGAQLLIDAGRL